LKNLDIIASAITKEMELFIWELKEITPEKDFTFDANEKLLQWVVKWESSKYYAETFEVEIWSDNKNYTLRGEHIIDNLADQVNEDYLLYEDKSSAELISKIDEIIQNFKTALLEINNIN